MNDLPDLENTICASIYYVCVFISVYVCVCVCVCVYNKWDHGIICSLGQRTVNTSKFIFFLQNLLFYLKTANNRHNQISKLKSKEYFA